jgi:hypothetical protein
MADDPRPDERDPELARRLAVEPLDELTRRRLVQTALREGAPARPTPRTWRWLAVAAVAVVVVAVGLAVVTAQGGHDEPTALQERSARTSAPPVGAPAPASAGDFGDLDRRDNRDTLRAQLADRAASKGTPEAQTADRAAGALSDTSASASDACPFTPPFGATVLGSGTGTIDGRRTTVYLVERADGTRTYEAVLEAPCEDRRLP